MWWKAGKTIIDGEEAYVYQYISIRANSEMILCIETDTVTAPNDEEFLKFYDENKEL